MICTHNVDSKTGCRLYVGHARSYQTPSREEQYVDGNKRRAFSSDGVLFQEGTQFNVSFIVGLVPSGAPVVKRWENVATKQ